jgi:hypothetical protein
MVVLGKRIAVYGTSSTFRDVPHKYRFWEIGEPSAEHRFDRLMTKADIQGVEPSYVAPPTALFGC